MKEIIAISKSHEKIKMAKQLKNTSKPKNLFLVEDLSILQILVNQKRVFEDFIFCSERMYSNEAQAIIEYAKNNANNIYTISNKTFEILGNKDNSIGIIAIVKKKELNIKTIDDDIVLVLDHLENAGNVGTLLRSADACKIKTVIFVDSVVNINNYKVIQSSRGTIFTENIYEMDYNSAKDLLLKNGYTLYLGEPILGKAYNEYDYNSKTAIVIGSERFGINQKWYDEPHKKVFIPMYGIMTSLNVGVAGAILMYEARMKKEKNNGSN